MLPFLFFLDYELNRKDWLGYRFCYVSPQLSLLWFIIIIKSLMVKRHFIEINSFTTRPINYFFQSATLCTTCSIYSIVYFVNSTFVNETYLGKTMICRKVKWLIPSESDGDKKLTARNEANWKEVYATSGAAVCDQHIRQGQEPFNAGIFS